MIILGIDPGLTRCGWGLVEASGNSLKLLDFGVWRTPTDMDVSKRLVEISSAFDSLLRSAKPDHVALERVFAQQNLRTVMGIAQISGLVMAGAEQAGIPLSLHTPSEVKASIAGYGKAEKAQVGAMVAKTFGLAEAPKPADTADAIALAVTAARKIGRGSKISGTTDNSATEPTSAQQIWLAAEAKAKAGRSKLG
ncbi:MAG: crossover junction endodeoxyribonuclease RuvC [Microbacteriaceae bacterium]|nr:crossover junction endodeoxyribonuclease RuvC [Microbacteriaceae bacterium]